LYECLETVVKLMAPVAPFLAEEIFRNLNTVTGRDPATAVHLSGFPRTDASLINLELEARMERAERIVMLVRAMRMKANLKVRQPLRRIILPIVDGATRASVQQMEDVICDEINVKAIEYVTDESGLVKKRGKPNFKSIGPRFGKAAQQIAARIKELTPAELIAIERDGSVELTIGGASHRITAQDVEIVREDIQGWLVESDGSLTVALDTELDETLITEGCAREFVNRVQNMRKEAGFEVTDRVIVAVQAPPVLAKRLESMSAYIMAETLAEQFTPLHAAGEYQSTVDINGESVDVSIKRVTRE
jgi:isoleucyl-tRNA synthetase